MALIASGGGAVRYLTQDPAEKIDVFRGGNSFAWSPDGHELYSRAAIPSAIIWCGWTLPRVSNG